MARIMNNEMNFDQRYNCGKRRRFDFVSFKRGLRIVTD